MRTLYFDVDGTVVYRDRPEAKSRLADGAFERAVRAAGFDRLVCVGNYAAIAEVMCASDPTYDALGGLFQICAGAFIDDEWFRSVTTLVSDPNRRVELIDVRGDWFYVDDFALEYCQSAGLEALFEKHRNDRILATDPLGDGQDVQEWLEARNG